MATWERIERETRELPEAERQAIIARWMRDSSQQTAGSREVEVGSGSRFDPFHGYLPEDD